MSTAPITLVDATKHIWLLGVNINLSLGAQLLLVGSAAGGDVDEVRLLSNNTGAVNSVVSITANYGNVLINSTKFLAWDQAANGGAGGPDTETATYKRAYIAVYSSLAADGVTPLNSRMDVSGSDVGYLGYNTDKTGLGWSVNGSISKTPNLYDIVDTLGDVTSSRIHDNYYGASVSGGLSMNWANNEFDHNLQEGVYLGNHGTNIDFESNNLHDNGVDGLQVNSSSGLTIRGNTAQNNGNYGFLLKYSDGNDIESNTARNNGNAAGISLYGSNQNIVRNNVLAANKIGIRLNYGSQNNQVSGNDVGTGSSYGIQVFGSDVADRAEAAVRQHVREQHDPRQRGLSDPRRSGRQQYLRRQHARGQQPEDRDLQRPG